MNINRITLNQLATLVFLVASFYLGQVSAEVIVNKEEQTNLNIWEWHESGISIRLIQRTPDQTRAFLQARNFSSSDSDIIAKTCVFQTIFRNDGVQSLSYNLSDWQVSNQGNHHSILTREHWNKSWEQSEVTQAAQIAFRWALLPTKQQFEPGDYNWGMISFGLPPGEAFDLTLKVKVSGNTISRSIPDIVCATNQTGN
jgi:hypothetical protein